MIQKSLNIAYVLHSSPSRKNTSRILLNERQWAGNRSGVDGYAVGNAAGEVEVGPQAQRT